MGIPAVVAFVAGGIVVGTISGVVALRKGERPGTVATFSIGAIVFASFMFFQWLFWTSLEMRDLREALMPDFFSPGRKEQILNMYGLWFTGLAGLVVVAWGKLRKPDR